MQSRGLSLGMVATLAAAVLLLAGSTSANASNSGQATLQPAPDTVTAATLQDSMRKLWSDHIAWTRLAIIEISDNLPGQAATVDRLLQNQVDIGNAIKPYYGERAGSQLTALLTDHIIIASDLIKAAKMSDMASVELLNRRWQDNGDDISFFLSQANPVHWKFNDIRMEMRKHLDLTLTEASLYIKGDYAGSVAAYDKVHEQILGMADMLAMGIEMQFPDRFGETSPVSSTPPGNQPGSVPQVATTAPPTTSMGSAY